MDTLRRLEGVDRFSTEGIKYEGVSGQIRRTHLIAMKTAGQPEIFMFTNNICDQIFMQHQGFARY